MTEPLDMDPPTIVPNQPGTPITAPDAMWPAPTIIGTDKATGRLTAVVRVTSCG